MQTLRHPLVGQSELESNPMLQSKSLLVAISAILLMTSAALPAENAHVPDQLLVPIAKLTAVLPQWTVHQVDPNPSVAIDDQSGYRIVLRSTWKEAPANQLAQQQVAAPTATINDSNFITKHFDWHFVLVPGTAQLTPQAKRQILWHVPDEEQ